MKNKIQTARLLTIAATLCLTVFSYVGNGQVQQKTNAQISPADKQAIAAFENRVKEYVKLRNQVKDKLPKLSKDSTPEQIESYRKSFEEALRAARAGVKPGDIFNTAGA